MQLQFVGRNIEVTDALKKYASEKLQPLQNRYSRITLVTITFNVENVTQISDATIHFDGTEIHATAKSDDMYKSIDMLVDKLLGQINKHKEKVIDSHR